MPAGRPFPEVIFFTKAQAATPSTTTYEMPSAAPRRPEGPGGSPHPVL